MLKNKRIRNAIMIVLFISCVALAYKVGSDALLNKRIFDLDESLSLSLANSELEGWVAYTPQNWFTQSFFKQYIVTDKPFNYAQVILNQTKDVHPPLYYLILHTIFSMNPGEYTPSMAFGMNFVSYIVNTAVIYLLVSRHSKSILAPAITSVFYLSNPLVLKILTLLRMYQLVSSFSLLFIFSGLEVVLKKKPAYILLALFTLLGGLTHYYFYYTLIAVCIVFGIILLSRKRWKSLLGSAFSVAVPALANLFVIFPATQDHLFSEDPIGAHGSYARYALSSGRINADRLKEFLSFSGLGSTAFRIVLAVVMVTLFLTLFVKLKKLKLKKAFNIPLLMVSCGLFGAYCLYVLVTSQTASYITPRYLIAGEMIMFVAVGLFIGSLPYEVPNIALALLTCFLFSPELLNSNEGTISSYQYAVANGGPAIVVSDEVLSDNEAGKNFSDFMNYSATGFLVTGQENFNPLPEDFTLYCHEGTDIKKVKPYLEKLAGKLLTFEEKTDVIATDATIYEVHHER